MNTEHQVIFFEGLFAVLLVLLVLFLVYIYLKSKKGRGDRYQSINEARIRDAVTKIFSEMGSRTIWFEDILSSLERRYRKINRETTQKIILEEAQKMVSNDKRFNCGNILGVPFFVRK